MSGHLGPEIGRVFEDAFTVLLERLGYDIWRKRDVKTGLDVVATFRGLPEFSEIHHKCDLLKPVFSPDGVIAFSAKKGSFTKKDVEELIEKINNGDIVKVKGEEKNIENGVIVTNRTLLESRIEKILLQDIYVWDIIRILFYANKTRICYDLGRNNPIEEHYLFEGINGSYLLQAHKLEEGIMYINIVILIDDHIKERIISADHLISILEFIYDNSLVKIFESTPLHLQTYVELHSLNMIDQELLNNAYLKYAKDNEAHLGVSYSPVFNVYSYVSRPWSPFLNLLSS